MADTQRLPIQLEEITEAAAEADSMLGQKVGEYVVEAVIAAGGMGIVYRARHPVISRRVAIKVVRPEWMKDREQADRFLKEAQALSAIKHDRIIEIIGFGSLEDGRQYMVMEFLEGESLEDVMTREGAMAPHRALELVDEILSALSAAHLAGVVHRDLKPSNVFISLQSNGEHSVKVLDFGLAKQAPVLLEPSGAASSAEKSSLLAGTPEYIAPEQARALAASPQTDLYSLGVMLFEMLSGELPFAAADAVLLLRKHVFEKPRHISSLVNGLPQSIDALVASLLEKEPERRPVSAELVRRTVTRILRELREQSTRHAINPLLGAATEPLPAPVVVPARRSRTAWIVPVLALVLVGGITASWFLSRSLPVPPLVIAAAPALEAVRPVVVERAAEEPPAAAEEAFDDLEALGSRPRAPRVAKPKVEVSNPRCADLGAWRDEEKTRSDEIEGRVRGKLVSQQASRETINATLATLRPVRELINRAATRPECGSATRSLDSWAAAHGI